MWIITKEEGREIIKPIMSRDWPDDTESQIKASKYSFRMFDSEGVLWYEGVSDNKDFKPMDDFGGPNVGCTSIEYWNEGDRIWEML